MIGFFIGILVGTILGYSMAALTHSASTYSRDEEDDYNKK